MKNPARLFAWRGPPLALQILGLLLGGLVVAQGVTLALTLFLPPDPPAKYGLSDIAARFGDQSKSVKGLQRQVSVMRPAALGRGWLSSSSSRDDLARLLGVSPDRVTLSFYTPLPFAGTVGTVAEDTPVTGADMVQRSQGGFGPNTTDATAVLQPAVFVVSGQDASPANLLKLMQAGPGPGGPGGPLSGGPGGGFPGGGFPGGGFPGGGMPIRPNISPGAPTAPAAAAPPPVSSTSPGGDAAPAGPLNGPISAPPPSMPVPSALAPTVLSVPGPGPVVVVPGRNDTQAGAAPTAPSIEAGREPAAGSAAPPDVSPVLRGDGLRFAGPLSSPVVNPPDATTGPYAADDPSIPRTGLEGVIDRARKIFGFAPTPFVEGDFIATLAMPGGRWIVVQPESNGWLSPWQQRVLLWFVIAFGITAPIGWLFARRLSQPLARFAEAAGQLGRDPSIAIAALDGPAEIGRAAHAFNLMQKRLRSFVDDRTAMVGAISHDLRTPLTRMRFRIEDAPDAIRGGIIDDLDEMEEMITSVLAFIRDASTPGVRERLDLRTLLDDVAEDAAVIGADVPISADTVAMVEVEVMGMRRVLVNLVENALKYGDRARIELTVSQDEAIAAIIDDGPGLPDEELEQVFQPFYRTASARVSGVPGTGLGLAVCRSIARAHGGDVRLCRTPTGFRAEVRVPLVYDAMRALGA